MSGINFFRNGLTLVFAREERGCQSKNMGAGGRRSDDQNHIRVMRQGAYLGILTSWSFTLGLCRIAIPCELVP